MGPQSARPGSGCHPWNPGCRSTRPGSGSRPRPGRRGSGMGRRGPVPATPQAGPSTTSCPGQPGCRRLAAGHGPGSRTRSPERGHDRDRTGRSRRLSGRSCSRGNCRWCRRPTAGQADTGMRAEAWMRGPRGPGWASRPAGSCPRSSRTGYRGPPALREPRRRRSGHCPSPGPGPPGWPDTPGRRPGSAAGWLGPGGPGPGGPEPGGQSQPAAGRGWSARPGRSVAHPGRSVAHPGSVRGAPGSVRGAPRSGRDAPGSVRSAWAAG